MRERRAPPGTRGRFRRGRGPRPPPSTASLARATKSIASPYTSSFSWSNDIRGAPSGLGLGLGLVHGRCQRTVRDPREVKATKNTSHLDRLLEDPGAPVLPDAVAGEE